MRPTLLAGPRAAMQPLAALAPSPTARCCKAAAARLCTPRPCLPRRSHRRPLLVHSSAAAAASAPAGQALPAEDEKVLVTPRGYRPPPALPSPPAQATLVQVLPWLARIAFGEAQLTARLGLALVLLITAKAAGLSAPFFFKRAVDALSAGTAPAALAAASTALLLSGVCRMVAGVAKELQGPMFAPVAQDAGRRVSFYTFAHVLGLDLQFHLSKRTGALSRMLDRGARSVSMVFRAVVFTFVPTAVELAAVCLILARAFHPRVSALVLATFACYAAWTVALTRVAAGIRRRVKELDNDITGKAVDALLNFETVKLFDNAGLEVRQYDSSVSAYQKSVVRLDLAAAALNAGQAIILAGGMTGVMLAAAGGGLSWPVAGAAAAAATTAGAAAAGAGAITAGDLVMIQGLLLQLWAPLQFLGWFYRELRQSLVDMEDLFTLLRTPTRLPEGSLELPPAPLPSASAVRAARAAAAANGRAGAGQQLNGWAAGVAEPEAAALEERRRSNGAASSSSSSGGSNGSHDSSSHGSSESGLNGRSSSSSSIDGGGSEGVAGLRLELRDVWFGYGSSGSGGRQVLKGVSLVAEPGESIAVVGPSGGGKSTVLRLLVRLYDCDAGQVLLNGVDVRDLRQHSLRGAVAVVPQDTVLFNDTILHNVAYGQPGASMREVKAAAAAAKLDAAIARMPAGWGTVVGERGLKLSGGEKQRVAIARAFLRQPRLLICDEATSALDTATERGIQASLRELAAGRTSVFVAHRLSTVQACDRIYVLSDGQVAEEGTYQQLMAAKGLFWEMWNLQAAEQELEEHLQHSQEEEGRYKVASVGESVMPSLTEAEDGGAGEGGGLGGEGGTGGFSGSEEEESGLPRPMDGVGSLGRQ